MKPSQISDTATFITIKFYGLTKDEQFRALFDEDVLLFYERLIGSLPYPYQFYERGLNHQWLRRFFIYWEELLLPGDLMHILMRKWFLQKMVNRLKKEGYSQLIVLGAGLDHLAALQSSKGLKAIEFDAHRMSSLKKDFLINHDYMNNNLHIIPMLFSTDGHSRSFLNRAFIDPDKPTIVVAEGFFDYLTKAQCSVLLKDITTYFHAPVHLLSSIFSLRELSAFHSFVYDKSIRLAGEKLNLHLNRMQFKELLIEHDFTIGKMISYRDMERDVLEPRHIYHPVLPGFYLLKAKYCT